MLQATQDARSCLDVQCSAVPGCAYQTAYSQQGVAGCQERCSPSTRLVRSRERSSGRVPASVRTPSSVMAEQPLRFRRVSCIEVPQMVSSVASLTAGLQYRDRPRRSGCLESRAASPAPVSLRASKQLKPVNHTQLQRVRTSSYLLTCGRRPGPAASGAVRAGAAAARLAAPWQTAATRAAPGSTGAAEAPAGPPGPALGCCDCAGQGAPTHLGVEPGWPTPGGEITI